MSEPILVENPNRFVLFPINHQAIWKCTKNIWVSFWTARRNRFKQ